MTVGEAVDGELGRMPEPVRSSGLAWAARLLAARLDEAGVRDSPGLARELRQALGELREMAGHEHGEDDPIVDLAARRADRRKGA